MCLNAVLGIISSRFELIRDLALERVLIYSSVFIWSGDWCDAASQIGNKGTDIRVNLEELVLSHFWIKFLKFWCWQLLLDQRKLAQRSERVKSVDLHPTEPWYSNLVCLIDMFLCFNQGCQFHIGQPTVFLLGRYVPVPVMFGCLYGFTMINILYILAYLYMIAQLKVEK